MNDWRLALLDAATEVPVTPAARDPLRWPGYAPRAAVSVHRLPAPWSAVAAAWDFGAVGGSFGEDDATALASAVDVALAERLPLVTLLRSGGTRLQEGMAALVGIPRARLALGRLARAGLPHVAVVDQPTTGGVWISVGAPADLRLAVDGAVVGFGGPRVVQAVTGELPGPDSHHARAALAAGLVDVVAPEDGMGDLLARALAVLRPGRPAELPLEEAGTAGNGWEQVVRARARTRSGRALLAALLDDAVALRAPRDDRTVAAAVGRLSGAPVVGVALAAELGGRPTPDGYRLAARAFALADRLRLPVVSLVDTPGAEPGPAAEADGIAREIGTALDALLACRTPTVALVHGEGGSGGALAAAATDVVLVTPDAYFAAIGPEGAEAALRRPAPECADLMRISPHDLVALGLADGIAPSSSKGAAGSVVSALCDLLGQSEEDRLRRREQRWSSPLPGSL